MSNPLFVASQTNLGIAPFPVFFKKTRSTLIALTSVFFFFAACEKEPRYGVSGEAVSVENLNTDNADDRSAITLTVNSTTERARTAGNSFTHELTLKNGSTPLANKQIGINDPIGLLCTWVTTNSQGKATWTRTTTSSTVPRAYTIDFFYTSIKKSSTIAVKPTSGYTTLSNYKMDYTTVLTPNNATLVGGDRGGFQTTAQNISTTLQVGAVILKDIGQDYVKNPGNLVIAGVAAVSCTAGQFIPAAGQAVCATSAKMVASGLAQSAVKILAKKAVDTQTQWPSATRTNLKNLIDLGSMAFAITEMKPGGALKTIENLATSYDVLANANGVLLKNSQGTVKGAAIPAQLSGTDKVYGVCFYLR